MTGIANPKWNPWANDRRLLELYRRRARREVDEMTCAAQAADILSPLMGEGESLLDAGCGGGCYYWSFRQRRPDLRYFGLDYTPEMIALAREELVPAAGLDPACFMVGAIEDLSETYDNIVCFNVLTNSPHYALPLECLLRSTRKRLLIRESMDERLVVRFSPDLYLDEDKRHIRVYHNSYPESEVMDFISENGFRVTRYTDRRCGDGYENVCDIPHRWVILLAERASGIPQAES